MAMSDFGLPISDADTDQLLAEREFLRFGYPPSRIEILNFLDGCDFDTAFARAKHEQLAGIDVAVLGLGDCVAAKRASGRPKDLSDLYF